MHLVEFIMRNLDRIHSSEDMIMSIGVEANKSEEEENELFVTLRVGLRGEEKGQDEGELNMSIAATIEGCFEVSEKVADGVLEQFANINAAALLYSELRPTIKLMSMQYGEEPIILPFFNFVKRYEELSTEKEA